jgi:hypothetical protein
MIAWEPGVYNVELTIETLLSAEGSDASSMVELMSPTVQLEVMPAQ